MRTDLFRRQSQVRREQARPRTRTKDPQIERLGGLVACATARSSASPRTCRASRASRERGHARTRFGGAACREVDVYLRPAFRAKTGDSAVFLRIQLVF